MAGIPHQTPDLTLATVDNCAHLVGRFGADARLKFHVALLGPFRDTESRAFEDPTLRYHMRFTSREGLRRTLEALDWREVLSFASDAMDHRRLVATTYEVAARLNELKAAHRLVDEATCESVRGPPAMVRTVLDVLDRSEGLGVPTRRARLGSRS